MELFYYPELNAGERVKLGHEESLHLKAKRIRTGEAVQLTDGKGHLSNCSIEWEKNDTFALINDVELHPYPEAELHIAIAPTKNMERTEWFVEKAVEAGIKRISFVQCEHSERTTIKEERLTRVAISAIKQSGELWMPEFSGMISFEDFLKSSVQGLRCIAWCGDTEPKIKLKDIIQPTQSVTVLIGPEGDFTHHEVQLAKSAGFVPVSLGEKRLRTETAALYATIAFNFINS